MTQGLAAALAALAARSPVPVDLDVEGAEPDLGTRTALYYVCAEALANTVKHASATAVTIRVVATPHLVTTEVADDGIGGADVAHGSGLRGLIDRVEALDGRVDIDSPAGGGTRISVELPVVPSPAAVVATGQPPSQVRRTAIGAGRRTEPATMPAAARVFTVDHIGCRKGVHDEIDHDAQGRCARRDGRHPRRGMRRGRLFCREIGR